MYAKYKISACGGRNPKAVPLGHTDLIPAFASGRLGANEAGGTPLSKIVIGYEFRYDLANMLF